MATNKHAQIRYNTLDKCFRNTGRNYTLDQLLEECNEAITIFDPKAEGIKKRQLYEDIRFMQSNQGWSVEFEEGLKSGKKRIYRYLNRKFSIANSPLNEEEANQLKLAMMTLERFNFDWMDELSLRLKNEFKITGDPKKLIEFEENEFLKGKENITGLYNAIRYKTPLKIKYKSFKSQQIQEIIFHPYFLKQYNNRWFLFGQNKDFQSLTNMALDRIISFKNSNEKFIEKDIDFKEYLDDIIGVTIPEKATVEKIMLKIDIDHWPYIETKPLHHSQTKHDQNNSHVFMFLKVIPNYELETLLLQHGEKIEVLEPLELRQRMAARVNQLNKLYNTAD